MIGLLQRVSEAKVMVDGLCTGEIGEGLLVLLCAQRGDTPREAQSLLNKLLSYRVFPDERQRMNRSLLDRVGQAGLLVVPQFTLAADTRSGTRPSFTPAAAPALASALFDHFVSLARAGYPNVHTGVFGADMKVHLVNDGPVTFWLEVTPAPGKETA